MGLPHVLKLWLGAKCEILLLQQINFQYQLKYMEITSITKRRKPGHPQFGGMPGD